MVSVKFVRGGATTLLLVMIVILASCAGDSPLPGVSFSVRDSVIRTVSTTFDPGSVDTGGGPGWYSSIAIDPDDDYPAIAYYATASGGSLRFAKWDGADWDVTTVDSDGIVGMHASLAFDNSGCPSIAYYNATDESLMWAYDEDDDGEWDDNEDWPFEIDPDVGDWGEGERNCSHDISGNEFGFAYYDENDGDLICLSILGNLVTNWNVEVDTSDDVGKYCSLHMAGSNTTVSYYDSDNGYLKFAKKNTPYWDVEQVDDGQGDDIGMYSSLSYKSSSVPTIAYYNDTDGKPWLVTWNTSTSEWDPVCLYDTGLYDYGMWMSHDWDPVSGTKAGFSFYDNTNDTLKFILYDGEDYTEYTPDSIPGYYTGQYASFAWADDDIGWISHYCVDSFGRYHSLRCVEVDDS